MRLKPRGAGVSAEALRTPVISVATMGDSWVGLERQLTRHIQTSLQRRGLSAGIWSFSYPGLRGAPMYRKLSNDLAAWRPVQANYGVLSVGINDALAHSGSGYYAHYTSLLLKSIWAIGIKPLLIELPSFGQQAAIQEESWHSGIRHTVNRYLFDFGRCETIETYRRHLANALRTDPVLLGSVILVDPDPVIGAFSPSNHLWENPSHLSAAGDLALGSAIAGAIALDFESR